MQAAQQLGKVISVSGALRFQAPGTVCGLVRLNHRQTDGKAKSHCSLYSNTGTNPVARFSRHSKCRVVTQRNYTWHPLQAPNAMWTLHAQHLWSLLQTARPLRISGLSMTSNCQPRLCLPSIARRWCMRQQSVRVARERTASALCLWLQKGAAPASRHAFPGHRRALRCP